ncbi:MAG: hypothetical protein AB7S78_09605 [Candidatus Omnitrophota bacterium]
MNHMGEKIDLFFIVSLIWIFSAAYAGLALYKQFLHSHVEIEVLQKQAEESDPDQSKPYKDRKEWSQKAEGIRKDHKSLVDSYKRRQRDHKRITANLFKR